jgi:hypothetical protein
MIYSNVREIVEHQQYVFDTLWNKSIPSEEKIKEIEEGIQPRFIETVRNLYQAQELLSFAHRPERKYLFYIQLQMRSVDKLSLESLIWPEKWPLSIE